MTFKEQAIETCKSIWGYAQSGTKKIFNFIGQKSRNIYEAEIVQQGIDKSKNFYQDHKKVCIGFGVALVTLAIVGIRMKKKKSNNETVKDPEVQEQQYKKPSQVVGKKSFLDELAEDDPYEDQVSTDAIRKQMIPKIRKNNQKKAKQIAQQDQREDKIFYQMYSMYKTAGQQK